MIQARKAMTQVARGMKTALVCATFTIVAMFATHAAFAAETPFAAPQAVERPTTVGAGSLAQVTLSLLLVLGAVFAAAWLVRRLRGLGGPGADAIRVVAATGLGPKERAVLVQVGSQQLLLGVTSQQVNLLHVLATPVGPHPNPPPATGGGDPNAEGTNTGFPSPSQPVAGRGDPNAEGTNTGFPSPSQPVAGRGDSNAEGTNTGFPSPPPPVAGGGQGGGRPDFAAILRRSLGLK